MNRSVRILVTVLLIALFSCGKNIREKWVDQDTYQVSAIGTLMAADTEKPALQRRFMACNAAKLNAMSMIIKKFAGIGLDTVKGKVERTAVEDRVQVVFSGTIKNGSVVKRVFDAVDNRCEVVYEIREKGLRRKVGEFMLKK